MRVRRGFPTTEHPRPTETVRHGAPRQLGGLPREHAGRVPAALVDGADIIETDLHLTADGVFVCIHDGDVDRTTDGHGPVAAMTLAEVKTLSASCGRPEFAVEPCPPWASCARSCRPTSC